MGMGIEFFKNKTNGNGNCFKIMEKNGNGNCDISDHIEVYCRKFL